MVAVADDAFDVFDFDPALVDSLTMVRADYRYQIFSCFFCSYWGYHRRGFSASRLGSYELLPT